MPTYDYACPSCGYRTEVFESFRARSQRRCPKCGGRKFKRLIGTGGAVIFRGSGFYGTDYRSPDYQKAAQKETAKPGSCSGEPSSCQKSDCPSRSDE